jgi:hypothetical protein
MVENSKKTLWLAQGPDFGDFNKDVFNQINEVIRV